MEEGFIRPNWWLLSVFEVAPFESCFFIPVCIDLCGFLLLAFILFFLIQGRFVHLNFTYLGQSISVI